MTLVPRYVFAMNALCCGAALSGVGCDTPAPIYEGPACRTSVYTAAVVVNSPLEVDLLLVVDDSASMSGEQAELGDAVARVLGSVPWLTELDTSLHVGVVSSDLGTGGAGSLSEGCEYPLGHDGRMLRGHVGGDRACSTGTGALPYVSFEAGEDRDALTQRVSCLVHTGAGGCGFEQPLEAALKALTPAASDLRFLQERGGVIESDTGGHGDGPNAGFLREHSLLIIAIITDEDDCSTSDLDLFAPSGVDPQYPSPVAGPSADPSVQCAAHPGALYPVERYVEGFLALRPGYSHRTVFVVVGGVDPARLAEHTDTLVHNGFEYVDTDYEALLDEPAMQSVVDASGEALAPACTRPAPEDPDNLALRREATPARRLTAVAAALDARGAGSELVSVCSAIDTEGGDHRLDLGRLVPWLNSHYDFTHYPGIGISRSFERDADDLVFCRVTERLRVGLRCEDQPGRTIVSMDDEREVCVLDQLAVPPEDRVPGADIEGAGWYYDDFNPDLVYQEQLIHFTDAGYPRAGSTYRVECIEQVCDEE